MAQLLIRDLDDDTIKRLKAHAISQGRSLQKEVKLIIEEAAQQNHAEAWETVNRFRRHFEKTGRSFSDSVELIREDRG